MDSDGENEDLDAYRANRTQRAFPAWAEKPSKPTVIPGGRAGGGGGGGGGGRNDEEAEEDEESYSMPIVTVTTTHRRGEEDDAADGVQNITMKEMRQAYGGDSGSTCRLCEAGFMADGGAGDTEHEKKLRNAVNELLLSKSFPFERVVQLVARYHKRFISPEEPWTEPEVSLHLNRHMMHADVMLERDIQDADALQQEVLDTVMQRRGAVKHTQHQVGKLYMDLGRYKYQLCLMDRSKLRRLS